MTGRLGLVVVVAVAAVAAVPHVAPTYHVLLMLPFMAYGVVLLGSIVMGWLALRRYQPRFQG